MTQVTLGVGVLISLAVAVLFFRVSQITYRRSRRDDEGNAMLFFSLFWFGIGAVELVQAILTGAALLDKGSAPLVFTMMEAYLLFTLMAYLGLMYYLLYVYTGRSGILIPLVIAYALLFVFVQYVLAIFGPQGLEVQVWRGWFLFEQQVTGPIYLSAITLLYLPPLAAALAYGSLARLAPERSFRYRVVLIATSMGVHFLGSYVSMLNYEWGSWSLLRHLLHVLAVVGVYLGIRPPAWARRTFGAKNFEETVR